MRKPYVIVKIIKDGNDFILTQAEIYVPNKGLRSLNPERVSHVLNKYDGCIYEPKNNGKYRITEKRVIEELLARKVKRKNKYAGKALAVVSLLTVLSASNVAATYTSATKVKPPLANDLNKGSIVAFKNDIEPKGTKANFTLEEDQTYLTDDEMSYTDETKYADATPAFSYDFQDKSQNKEYYDVLSNQIYQQAIQKYAPMYGVDKALISAKISQENPYNLRNDTNVGARGVSQIESVWWGKELTAYNFETKSYETIIVDGDKLYDPDYAIKVGCMVLNQTYLNMFNKFVTNGTLTGSECIIAALTGYNMGGPTVNSLVQKYGADFINHRDEVNWGDKLYYEHVLSYLEDGTKITFLNIDGTESSVFLDNTTVNSFKR